MPNKAEKLERNKQPSTQIDFLRLPCSHLAPVSSSGHQLTRWNNRESTLNHNRNHNHNRLDVNSHAHPGTLQFTLCISVHLHTDVDVRPKMLRLTLRNPKHLHVRHNTGINGG